MLIMARDIEAFRRTLRLAMDRRGMSQTDLADKLGVSQNSVSTWLLGRSVPEPERVFAIERALDLEPGSLSAHLGYVPSDAPDTVKPGFREYVNAMPELDDTAKRAILGAYDAVVSHPPKRRGGRRPRG